MDRQDKAFLLRTYGEEYGPEAGPWNTSAASKYLEFRIAKFFEDHFTIRNGDRVCNIGIGAGSWDRYLSFRLAGGQLTSVDRDEICCRQLQLRLLWEQNRSPVRVLCSDVLLWNEEDERFDLVTMIGSTRMESGGFSPILNKAIRLLKPGGSFYYQTLDETERKADFAALCQESGMRIEQYLLDTTYDLYAQYFKAIKPSVP